MSMIRVDREGAIRTVTLTRPAKRNAMNLEMLAALEEVREMKARQNADMQQKIDRLQAEQARRAAR